MTRYVSFEEDFQNTGSPPALDRCWLLALLYNKVFLAPFARYFNLSLPILIVIEALAELLCGLPLPYKSNIFCRLQLHLLLSRYYKSL
jgi:hypothetical protein